MQEFGHELGAPSARKARKRLEVLRRASRDLLGAAGEAGERAAGVEVALDLWTLLEPLGTDVLYRFRLQRELAAGEHTPEEPYDDLLYADALPLLLRYAPRFGSTTPLEPSLEELLADEDVREYLRFNEYEEEEFFNREAFRLLFDSLVLAGALLDLTEGGIAEGVAERLQRLREIEKASGYRVEGLTAALSRKGTAPLTDE